LTWLGQKGFLPALPLSESESPSTSSSLLLSRLFHMQQSCCLCSVAEINQKSAMEDASSYWLIAVDINTILNIVKSRQQELNNQTAKS
jgi:formate dehydrogenase assembly factor FdhD